MIAVVRKWFYEAQHKIQREPAPRMLPWTIAHTWGAFGSIVVFCVNSLTTRDFANPRRLLLWLAVNFILTVSLLPIATLYPKFRWYSFIAFIVLCVLLFGILFTLFTYLLLTQ
jgi:hypothetical protein